MTTTRTWIGGGNNRANNSQEWSPAGAPQPGDSLTIAAGTMNIVGGDLAGDSPWLNLGGPFPYLGPITLNLSQHAVLSEYLDPYVPGTSVTFNLSNSTLNLFDGNQFVSTVIPTINLGGVDTFHLNVEAGSGAVVNLGPNSRWVGDIYVHALGNHDYGGNVVVNGGLNASFVNQASEIDSGHTTITPNVVGAGSFGMGLKDSYAGHPATLEFAGSVGRGQTVTMSDVAHTANTGLLLQLDKPTQFNGSVTLSQGSIDLVGLANADSYSFKNDMLSIYSGNNVIDTLRLHDSSQYGLTVQTIATGVAIAAISDPTHPPMGLPIHV